jgi:hypothetical protein
MQRENTRTVGSIIALRPTLSSAFLARNSAPRKNGSEVEIRQPDTPYLLVPKVSSENREYIPMGFLPPAIIASGIALIVPDATPFHFGVLSSAMHNSWLRRIGGRMKSDPQYSSNLVYNNYPWPQGVTETQKAKVESAAQGVLDARGQFPDATLADLYDPNAMPATLRRAHERLDRAVDACYRRQPFDSERQRLEFLFGLYEQLVAPLTGAKKGRKARSHGGTKGRSRE